MTQLDFLQQFAFGGLMSTAVGSPTYRNFINVDDLSTFIVPPQTDVYFGPAMCKTAGGEKENVLGTKVLWVDIDNPVKPLPTLPPSMVVFSGHGWHMYWVLDVPLLDIESIETLNKILIEDIPTSDKSCWNCNRVLRVPGTTNNKIVEAPIQVELKSYNPERVYTIADIKVLSKLSRQEKHKISTGDARGYRSRSERDWAILTALVLAGATDELILNLFKLQPCGDKAAENDHYLPHTLETIREKGPAVPLEDGVTVAPDGYYVPMRKGHKRISTFTYDPKVLLDGSMFGAPDALVGDVQSDGYVWPDITFSRSAFTSVSKFDKEAPVAAWQWLGHDDDLRKLLPFLLEDLKQKGLPKVAATPVMGLFKVGGAWRFLGHNQTLGSDQTWQGYQGPICWLPSQKEYPKMNLTTDITDEEVKFVADRLPLLNDPETIWPMIGWYTATCLKPWFEENGYRFPVLNVSGTRGSGKTTLIQRVFMPLMGQTDPKTFDSGTTRFVILSLLGSTNAIPVAFSEFRYGLVEQFIRYILLSYDTGHDPRGRGDQTIVDYPLTAPFSVDGEDLVEDPAARERVVVALLHPKAVEEGSTAYQAFQELRKNIPPNFGGHMIQQILRRAPEFKQRLEEAREELFNTVPGKLPDRVRNNHIVTYFGMKMWCDIVGVECPSADVLLGSINSVYDIAAGRGKTMSDSLVEDFVNTIVQGYTNFNYAYDREANVLWMQLASVHTWWLASRRRQGRGSLERDAIRAQLKEAPYSVKPQVVNDAWMFGIDLSRANELGLDIPSKLSDTTFVVRLS